MLTEQEVLWGYRFILDRDPETAAVVSMQIAHNQDWRTLRRQLLGSGEFKANYPGWCSTSKWVIAEIMSGRRKIWLDLSDDFVSRGVLNDAYEEEESAVLLQHLTPTSTFVDVGANIGWYALLASTVIGPRGHIHCLEPRLPTAEFLQRSVAINGLDSVISVHRFGLDRRSGQATLAWDPQSRNPGHSYLSDGPIPDHEIGQSIELRTLDSLGLDHVDVVKLDVEGAEGRVLEGGGKTIERCKPMVLSEIYPDQLRKLSGISPREYLGWFETRGYQAHIVDRQRNGERISDFPRGWHRELVNVLLTPTT